MKFKKTIIITVIALGTFFAGEIYLHIYKPSLVEFDPELGWKLKANFDRTYQQSTQKGKPYSARFQTNEYGFRTYGDNAEKSLKILVLGDSFTGDSFTSNDEAWFSILAKSIEDGKKYPPHSVTVWAGGSGGFGTLQELILAKRIKTAFKPDALILQFCSNDFVDNHLQLESLTMLRQLYLRRPYMNTEGKIDFSQDMLAPIYRSYLFENSRLINKFDSYINLIEFMYYGGYQKNISPDLVKRYEGESLKITQSLLLELGYEFPNIPKVMVNCSGDQGGLNSQWQTLAKNAGFTPISRPTEIIKEHLLSGEDLVHADGGHWNQAGNRLFGGSLYNALNSLDLIDGLASKK